jgi:oxygen-independent coproporphyrinogen-3 oxidase
MNKQIDRHIESLYLHFPFCAHLCNYCDFYKRVAQDKNFDYPAFHQYLEKSFLVHKNLMKERGYSWAPLKTFYIGGGTPSLWGIEGKIFLERFLKAHNLVLDNNCEFTMEVNPGAWTVESLTAWQELGVNRFSLGVQSLNKKMIPYLDRIHSIEQVHETLEYFKKHNLNFSVDFMLGLPFSKEEKRDVIAELETALTYNPSHFSVYILTVKDNYTYFANLPSEDWIAEEYLSVSNFLKQKGFAHYEVSNFALKGKQSIHNLNYWKSKTVAAFGPSATGFMQEELLRYKWKTQNAELDYEQITNEEFKLEKSYMSLRSQEGLDISNFPESINELVQRWKNEGYTESIGKKILLTSKGYLFLDSLMSDLFALKII